MYIVHLCTCTCICFVYFFNSFSVVGYSATMFNLQSTTNVTIATGIKVLPSLPQLNARLVPKCVVSTASSSSHSSYQPTSSAALPSSPIKMAARHQSLSSLENIELLDGEVLVCRKFPVNPF